MKLVKHLLLISALSISSIAAAAHSHYVGADAHWHSNSIRKLAKDFQPRHLHGGNVHTGVRFDNFWGIEAGTHLTRAKKNGSTSRVRGIHLGLVGVLPMVKEGVLDFIVGVGAAHIKHASNQPFYKLDVSRVVPRVMAGLEYKLCSSLKLRTALTYEGGMSLRRKAHIPRGRYGATVGLIYGL